MKQLFLISALFLLLVGINNNVYSQAEGFGIGVILGEPTGLSVKKWTGDKSAFDGAVSWSFTNDFLYVHADYLRHSFDLIDINQGQLPIYYGLGAKIGFGNDLHLGARVPIGINYIFGDSPLDLFLEVVPGLSLIPDVDFDFGAGLGIRYFIK